MKIVITGTRGIPNRYGGFEEFAEQLSIRLAEQGHDVMVCNPLNHPDKGTIYHGVRILWIRAPLHFIAHVSGLFYDYRSLKNALKQKPGIILNCGYGSSLFYPLLKPRHGITIITHMDGMEWKRRKWGWLARRYLKMAERLAVKWSDHLVTDHPVIQAYYARTYGIEPYCIPYGTKHHEEFKLAGFRDVPLFRKLGIRGNDYLLMIARLEPENNHDMIFAGYLNAGMAEPLLVVGDTGTKFGRRMYREFRSDKGIRFMGPVFDDGMLARLRHYCRAYIHGHSVGGTNPSLLDAMRAGCLILSHGNEYNRAVLGENGMYFSNSEQLAELLGDLNGHMERKKKWASANIRQTDRLYHWNEITRHYSRLFIKTGG